jgi:hypothetical protein
MAQITRGIYYLVIEFHLFMKMQNFTPLTSFTDSRALIISNPPLPSASLSHIVMNYDCWTPYSYISPPLNSYIPPNPAKFPTMTHLLPYLPQHPFQSTFPRSRSQQSYKSPPHQPRKIPEISNLAPSYIEWLYEQTSSVATSCSQIVST